MRCGRTSELRICMRHLPTSTAASAASVGSASRRCSQRNEFTLHQQKESPMSENNDAPNDPTYDPSLTHPFGPPPETPEPEAQAAPPNYSSLSIYKMVLIAGLAVATVLPNLFIS